MLHTFFWDENTHKPLRFFINRKLLHNNYSNFRIGNAGDIFTKDVIKLIYQTDKIVNASSSPRLLIIGSIIKYMRDCDIICGIGVKTNTYLPPKFNNTKIYGLRGPITYEMFKKAGYDMSHIRFLADPGLLISNFVEPRSSINGHVIYIPHYRERKAAYRITPKNIKVVDIDANPTDLANTIMSAELIYTSSLHGMVFAHALERPCVLVQPRRESFIKYEDYFQAVGIQNHYRIDTISEARFSSAPNSPSIIHIDIEEIKCGFPPRSELEATAVIR